MYPKLRGTLINSACAALAHSGVRWHALLSNQLVRSNDVALKRVTLTGKQPSDQHTVYGIAAVLCTGAYTNAIKQRHITLACMRCAQLIAKSQERVWRQQ